MKPIYRNALLAAATTPFAIAQQSAPPPPAGDAIYLDEVVVTANRTGQTLFEQIQPATLLEGESLQRNLQPTLGETLAREPGVSSTYFGPGASRPVIRGLSEDRVRVLQNGTSVLDVSNVSPDHAVATDPLTVRSVEVVRGPATLLYGPNTIGGVVNVIDGRIPEEKFARTWPTGKFGLEAGTAYDLFSQSGSVEWGAGPLVFHLDGFHRETDDVEIPGYARSAELRATDPPGTPQPRGTLPNSATSATGAGLGGSYIWAGGFLGFSYSGQDSDYGTVADPEVTIDLRQRRWDARGAVYAPATWIEQIDFKFGRSDYEHTEFEGAEEGTVFEIEGYNGRIELRHAEIGRVQGSVGFESQASDFSALGDEAFLPPVENRVNSLFVFEEIPFDAWRLQFGARYDRQTNDTQRTAAFGPALDREFDAFSGSAGVVWNPVEDYAVTLSAAYTQRPPTYVELFANGPHIATGSFEIGDAGLGTEDSLSLDLSLRKKAGRVTGSVSGFFYRFDDFVTARATGALDPEESLPIFAYEAVGADFVGGEIEMAFHLLEPVVAAPKPAAAGSDRRLDLILRADYVRAEDRDADEPLPRIPPFRASAALDIGSGPFGARLEGRYASSQHRHSENELPTDGYFLLDASLSYRVVLGGVHTTFYVKGTNLTDEEARLSTSFLKDVAPLAGRGIAAGLRAEF